MEYKYMNPWHHPNDINSSGPEFKTNNPPVYKYRGFFVFHRAAGWDYVINGVCVTIRAGATKYKEVIDGLLAGKDYFGSELTARALRMDLTEMVCRAEWDGHPVPDHPGGGA